MPIFDPLSPKRQRPIRVGKSGRGYVAGDIYAMVQEITNHLPVTQWNALQMLAREGPSVVERVKQVVQTNQNEATR